MCVFGSWARGGAVNVSMENIENIFSSFMNLKHNSNL